MLSFTMNFNLMPSVRLVNHKPEGTLQVYLESYGLVLHQWGNNKSTSKISLSIPLVCLIKALSPWGNPGKDVHPGAEYSVFPGLNPPPHPSGFLTRGQFRYFPNIKAKHQEASLCFSKLAFHDPVLRTSPFSIT